MSALSPWIIKEEELGEFSYFRHDITDTKCLVPIVYVSRTSKTPHYYIAKFLPFVLTGTGNGMRPNFKTTRFVFEDLDSAKSSIDEYARNHGYVTLTDEQFHKLKCMI